MPRDAGTGTAAAVLLCGGSWCPAVTAGKAAHRPGEPELAKRAPAKGMKHSGPRRPLDVTAQNWQG